MCTSPRVRSDQLVGTAKTFQSCLEHKTYPLLSQILRWIRERVSRSHLLHNVSTVEALRQKYENLFLKLSGP